MIATSQRCPRWTVSRPKAFFRTNSEYPKDNFWWDSQSRVTPGFQGGVHFLEPYTAALADLDACRITRGGLFLDKAHTELLQRFARAYRALPRRKFITVWQFNRSGGRAYGRTRRAAIHLRRQSRVLSSQG